MSKFNKKAFVLSLLNDEELNQKEASIKAKVSQKTVCIWVKEWKLKDHEKRETIAILRIKLRELSNSPKLRVSELEKLTDIILKLESELYLKRGFYQ
jgi:hypothetical protein